MHTSGGGAPHAASAGADPLDQGVPVFRADIEGLRAVAILLVIGFHSTVPGIGGGFVGVDVFFVVSGYLITSLLLNEGLSTGHIAIGRFYVRRARRLLPALLLVTLFVVAAGWWILAPMEQMQVSRTAFSTSLYYSNVSFAREGIDYLGAQADENPLLHTWSLAVEEQFYLVWPALVVVAIRASSTRSKRAALLILILALSLASLALSTYQVATILPRAFFGAPSRAWEFGFGAMGALLPAPASQWRSGRAANVLAWLGVALLAFAASIYSRQTPFPGIAALLPAVGTVAILATAAGSPRGLVNRVLATSAMQWIGKRSYSWYLWHWPLLVMAIAVLGPLAVTTKLAICVAALAAAHATFTWLEWPIRSRRVLAVSSSVGAVLAVAASLAVAAVSWFWRDAAAAAAQSAAQLRYTAARADIPTVYAQGCHRGYFDTDARSCSTGPVDAPYRIVLLGDSHAAQWYPAFARLSDSLGWRMTYFSKSACPAIDASVYLSRLRREYVECTTWRAHVLDSVAALRPDLVIVANAISYVTGGSTAADPPIIRVADWRPAANAFVQQVAHSARMVITLVDTPTPGFDVPICLARAEWRGAKGGRCAFVVQPAARQLAHELALPDTAAARVVDLTPLVCESSCLPVRDGYVVFRDDNHLTATFSASLASRLLERLPLRIQPGVAR